MVKLSQRAIFLLKLVDEATKRDSGGALVMFWLPPQGYAVSGGGDARCLKSLVDKELIEHVKEPYYYWFATTEKGHKEAKQ